MKRIFPLKSFDQQEEFPNEQQPNHLDEENEVLSNFVFPFFDRQDKLIRQDEFQLKSNEDEEYIDNQQLIHFSHRVK